MIVDSVIWIALKNARDKYHETATGFLPDLINQGKLYVTDYIINETFANLLRKTTSEIAISTLDMFTSSPEITIIYNNKVSFRDSIKIAKTYPGLSIVDANILYHSKKLDLTILTFDEYMNSVFEKIG